MTNLAALAALAAGLVAGWWSAPWLAALARVEELAVPPLRASLVSRPVAALVLGVVAALPTALMADAGLARAALPGLALAWWAAGAACLVDAVSHRLPNVLVLRLGGGAIAALLLGLLVGGQGERALGVVAGLAVGAGVLGVVAVAYPPGMGLGDVKLAGLLGAATLGPLAAGTGLALAVLLGGVVALIGLAVRRWHARELLAFGPFLLAGMLAALAVHALGAAELAVLPVEG